MQPLRVDATLADMQEYVEKMEVERGLSGLGLDSQCLKLAEEIGELVAAATGLADVDLSGLSVRAAIETGEVCRAVRKLNGDPSDPRGRTVVLTDRCADLALVTGAFARRLAFDLGEAFRAKECFNNDRVWT